MFYFVLIYFIYFLRIDLKNLNIKKKIFIFIKFFFYIYKVNKSDNTLTM